MLAPFYWGISWILLRWHDLWSAIGLTGAFLRTNWDWVLAIVFLVITVRAILFPVYVKQIKSQRAMQALAPQIKALQEKHKGDRESLQRETMELYRKEGTNPLMGCLPMVIQIPVMWSLFHVLRHLNPNRHDATKQIYGWTIAQFDGAAHAKLLGAPIAASFRSSTQQLHDMGASGTTVKIVAGILVVIMIVTTYMTSRQMILKTGWAEDPTQKMVQRLMLYGIPVSLLISGFAFPIGVVLYWTTTNLFSLGQQFWVLHKYPPPVMSKSSAVGASKSTPAKAPGKTPGTAKTPSTAKALIGRNGLTRRGAARAAAAKQEEQAATPAADGRALAPKPGAKPVNPKKGGPAKVTSPAKSASPAKQTASGKQGGTGTKQQSGTNAAKRTSG